MIDNRQFMALEWVISDIKETLGQAQNSLDSFVRDEVDQIQLKFCLTYIHQVYGGLHMAGFHGAAMIASEMEALGKQLLDGKITHRSEAVEVLGRAIQQFPGYLEHALEQKQDNPALVLPLLNDLRAVRDDQFMSESTLFTPDLSYAHKLKGARSPISQDNAQLRPFISKLRKMYQYAAASVMHKQEIDKNLGYLLKVSQRLQVLLAGTPRLAVWEIMGAFVNGLQDGLIEANASTKKLLRDIDAELKELEKRGTDALVDASSDDLLKNLLYYLYSAEDTTVSSQHILECYDLDHETLLTQSLNENDDNVIDSAAMQAIAKSILDEFAHIKVTLATCLEEYELVGDIHSMVTSLQRVADTLAILNVFNLRQEMLETLKRAVNLVDSEDEFPSDDITVIEQNIYTMEMALENALASSQQSVYPEQRQFSDAEQTALHESRNGLEEAKDSIVHYISTQWNIKKLQPVPALLRNVGVHLLALGLPAPKDILSACATYMETQLFHQTTAPKWEQLDSLADVIASVDYFLEVLSLTKQEDNQVLKNAEKGLIALGVPVVNVQKIMSGLALADDALDDSAQNDPIVTPPVLEDATTDTPHVATLYVDSSQTADNGIENTEIEGVDDDSSTAHVPVVDSGLEVPQIAPDIKTALSDEGAEAKAKEAEEPADDDDDLIDDEIIEIFIEEAAEVQETIAEFFPIWASDLSNDNALIEVRRAFHTLKGSGRMVRAEMIGELAWSVENMLNRIIDNTLDATPTHLQLIEKVRLILPEIVQAFGDQKVASSIPLCEQYQQWADELSKGNIPESLLPPVVPVLSVLESSELDSQELDDSEPETPEYEIDEQLWEIFSAEAETHLVVIREFIEEMDKSRPFFSPPSDLMQRAMHTLKGSAYMAEITPVAELMKPMELFAKDLRGYQVNIDEDILQLIRDSVSYTESALSQMSELTYPTIDKLNLFLARVAELRERSVGHLITYEAEERPKVDPVILETLMNDGMDLLLDIDTLVARWKSTDTLLDASLQNGALQPEWQTVADELVVVKHGAERANLAPMANLSEHLLGVYQRLLSQAVSQPSDEFYETLLDGHYGLLDIIDAIAAGQDLPSNDEALIERLDALQVIPFQVIPVQAAVESDDVVSIEPGQAFDEEQEPADELVIDELANGEHSDAAVVDTIDDIKSDVASESSGTENRTVEYSAELTPDESNVLKPEPLEQDTHDLVSEATELESDSVDSDQLGSDLDSDLSVADAVQEIPETAIDNNTATSAEKELEDHPEEIVDDVLEPSDDGSVNDSSENVPDEISEAIIPPILTQLQPLPVGDYVPDEEIDEEIIEIFLEEANEIIEDLDEAIHRWENGGDPIDGNQALQRLLHTFKGGARLAGLTAMGDLAHKYESFLIKQTRGKTSDTLMEDIHLYQDQLIHYVEALGASSILPDIFASEDALPSSEDIFGAEDISNDVSDSGLSNNDLDDRSENITSTEPQASTSSKALSITFGEETAGNPLDVVVQNVAQDAVVQDSIIEENDSVLLTGSPDNADLDGTEYPSKMLDDTDDQEDTNVEPYANDGNVLPFNKPTTPETDLAVQETSTAIERAVGVAETNQGNITSGAAVARRAAPQEMVKVSAELMEDLVNLAGETSISRGRVEQQLNDLGYSLEEMDSTVVRLQEQLRRLDIETEAQMIFRQEQLADREDFDPLEMDRYSQLQQLSRSLIESASDLIDLKATLTNKTRDAETVLVQQSRINTELQEGLMRSRMVPFSRLLPRLRRIVRQISKEVGKEVNFEAANAEGELDRNMMDRMIAPLEHMLRNAVDHGIEQADIRQQQGKPAEGKITLTLSREGGNVLLLLSDDGGGINVERTRQKAIERQLIGVDTQLTDQEILQFIFRAGFSTAETVTQISGRGVGMDVVSSEIKQLGGSIDIHSTLGQGTTFAIRLPFTVSVNRALMISMGDDGYAIPLNVIEGIARVKVEDLAGYYDDPESRFEYAGTKYQLRYLGSLLDKDAKPKIEGHMLPVPVLLVRSNNHAVALQVDSLQGSREIVVKSLGAQFSTVPGLSGATILGDGHVVVILDVHAMIRQHYLLADLNLSELPPVRPIAALPKRNPLVMVVDDSVTVRKVTTRFLEREGFDVVAAKDGVHAIEMLVDHQPDVMLLDIEMPRMDGFEVAKRVRSSNHTSDLPIIMITSRTGEKHRQTGLAAGANFYMGKPYQEDELLSNIRHSLLLNE